MKGFQVEPACMVACVALLNWRTWKSAPPYIIVIAPSPGTTDMAPTWRSSAPSPSGIHASIAAAMASCCCFSIVVTMRRPPVSIWASVRPSLPVSSRLTASVMYPSGPDAPRYPRFSTTVGNCAASRASWVR